VILIGLGANLSGPYGSPEKALQACDPVFKARGFPIVSSSHIWMSAPVPLSDQPWYRNAVVRVETALSPEVLITALHSIEADFGRVRSARNASRVLDLDLLVYDDVVLERDDLYVPHPRMHTRAFVLYPLQENAPDWIHPVLKQPVDVLIENLPDEQDIECLDMRVSGEEQDAA